MKYKNYTKQSWKGSVITCPIPPTMVTCGTVENPNVFTVAWTGILNTIPPVTYISVRPERYSHQLISESKEFVINLTTEELCRAADYCGVKSGRNTNKFADMNLSAENATQISAPILVQSPVNIECRVKDIVHLGSHDMFVADIVAIDVATELLDEKGKLCLDKANLLAYAHGEYFGLGKKLGTFGYSVRKKKKRYPNKK